MRAILASLAFIVSLPAAVGADLHDGLCHAPAQIAMPTSGPLAPLTRVRDYRAILEACTNSAGARRLAIRTMTVDSRALALMVDPTTLVTSLEEARFWACAPTSDLAEAATRFGQMRSASVSPTDPVPASAVLRREGLDHGDATGSFVTGDLCPSRRPLDRDFLAFYAQTSTRAPIALSISGLWLLHHADDFRWIREQMRSGALDVTWVNHSFHHPFVPRLPLSRNFLLRPKTDIAAEVLDTERLLIAQGETPSVFFRFPGLVANVALLDAVQRLHLVVLGAQSWLLLSPPPPPGAIILVHPNGNEPMGLRLFARYLAAGRLPRPFRPIVDVAP